MIRREFFALLGGAAAFTPLAAHAQSDRVRLIGALIAARENDPEGQARIDAFRQGLEELGWTEGRNIHIEYRWATATPIAFAGPCGGTGGAEAGRDLLPRWHAVLMALRRETRTIPIVFAQVIDPVGGGFVATLARPGGNITGFTHFDFAIGGKWLELLRADRARHRPASAVIFNPATAPYAESFRRDDARPLPVIRRQSCSGTPFATLPMIERATSALATRAQRRPDRFAGRVHHRSSRPDRRASGPAAVAGDLSVPLLRQQRRSDFRMASMPRIFSGARRSYVDRILKGDKPAELPVQAADKFELVINLKTAKALGLTCRCRCSRRADEVIE